jgi:hypothetical protein
MFNVTCYLLPAVPYVLMLRSFEAIKTKSWNHYVYQKLQTVEFLVLGLLSSSARVLGVRDCQYLD